MGNTPQLVAWVGIGPPELRMICKINEFASGKLHGTALRIVRKPEPVFIRRHGEIFALVVRRKEVHCSREIDSPDNPGVMFLGKESDLSVPSSALSLPLGVVIRRSPAASRWARWSWTVADVLPGAGPAEWRELRRDGETVEYHAATVPLEFWPADAEAYLTGLSARAPAVYVVMRRTAEPDAAHELEVVLATASPYEAQDYMDSGEEIVEQAPMSEGLIAVVRDFVERHREDEAFVKRQRDKRRTGPAQDGKGDPRIRQMSDVYRAPGRAGAEMRH